MVGLFFFVPSSSVKKDVNTLFKGILTVSASDKGTGKSTSVTIDNQDGRLSMADIERVCDFSSCCRLLRLIVGLTISFESDDSRV